MDTSGLNPQVRNVAEILRRHFDYDGRYLLETYIGSGMQADVFRIKKAVVGSTVSGPERVVVKIPMNVVESWDGIEGVAEEEAMKIYRGAAHVVQSLTFPRNGVAALQDPLAQIIEGVEKLPAARWIYMEWLENGTLGTFLERVARTKMPLPNRLLWRIFLCSIAWSDVHIQNQDGTLWLEDPRDYIPGLVNFNPDLGSGNLVFGEFVANDPVVEHQLSPILKMIDLGLVERKQTPTEERWRSVMKDFIGTVGEEMHMIVGTGRRDSSSSSTLDSDLEEIIERCMTGNRDARPEVEDLAELVTKAVKRRDAQWYRENMPDAVANPREEDEAIIRLVHKLILDANIIPDPPPWPRAMGSGPEPAPAPAGGQAIPLLGDAVRDGDGQGGRRRKRWWRYLRYATTFALPYSLPLEGLDRFLERRRTRNA